MESVIVPVDGVNVIGKITHITTPGNVVGVMVTIHTAQQLFNRGISSNSSVDNAYSLMVNLTHPSHTYTHNMTLHTHKHTHISSACLLLLP